MKKFPFKAVRAAIEQFNTRFPKMNWGGCAVMASVLAYHLKPLVADLNIVAQGGWSGGGNVDDARKNMSGNDIRSWNTQGVFFNHVWVEFKWNGRWYAIDSEDLHRRRQMHKQWGIPQGGAFTIKEMRALAGSPIGWNPSFDREQIPAIKRLAAKVFNPLKAT